MGILNGLRGLFGNKALTPNTATNVQGGMNLEQDSSSFLPIIRNFEDNDPFVELIVNVELGKNIGAFIAKVSVTAEGRTGIDYVLNAHLNQYSVSVEELFHISLHNLKNARLSITGLKDPETDETIIQARSEIGLATCILYDHNFVDKLKTDLNTNELQVTIINSGTVFFTSANPAFEKKFEQMATTSTHSESIVIHAATYLWENHTLKLVKKYRD